MTKEKLRRHLSGAASASRTLEWLQDRFLPMIVRRLNEVDSRKRLALYGGDRIPENERNLTDFRNRISLIVEYEFARAITTVLKENEINDLFCAYVVANRFPDLEIRHGSGELGLRFEVKCLQSTAEEKSANFSTLRKDLRPSSDFIIVFLWEWLSESTEVWWDRAPYIIRAYVFSASSLATLRDWHWLNSPPSDLGRGYQGFDIRYAVHCRDGCYSEEEGNLGKLLQLWPDTPKYQPPQSRKLRKTEADYLLFKREVVESGFKTLACQILPQLSAENVVVPLTTYQGNHVGFRCGTIAFLLAEKVGRGMAKLKRIMNDESIDDVWVLNDRYGWRHFRSVDGNVERIEKGDKPKTITDYHLEG